MSLAEDKEYFLRQAQQLALAHSDQFVVEARQSLGGKGLAATTKITTDGLGEFGLSVEIDNRRDDPVEEAYLYEWRKDKFNGGRGYRVRLNLQPETGESLQLLNELLSSLGPEDSKRLMEIGYVHQESGPHGVSDHFSETTIDIDEALGILGQAISFGKPFRGRTLGDALRSRKALQ